MTRRAAGRVAVYRGVGRFPSTVAAGARSVVGWGPTGPVRSVVFVGDVDGDGVGETVLALPLFGNTDVGAVYLLAGRAP